MLLSRADCCKDLFKALCLLEFSGVKVIILCLSCHVVLEFGVGHMQVKRWWCVEDVEPRNSHVAVQNAVGGCLITSLRPPSAGLREGVKMYMVEEL